MATGWDPYRLCPRAPLAVLGQPSPGPLELGEEKGNSSFQA